MKKISPSPPKLKINQSLHLDCSCCAAYKTKECTENSCPYYLDFDNLKNYNYRSLLQYCFKYEKSISLQKKILSTADYYNGEWFASKKHKERFEFALLSSEINLIQGKYSQIATLFLLTADNPLWQMVKNSAKYPSFFIQGKDIEGATTEQYALFRVANTISSEEKYRDLEELTQEQLISEQTFSIILRGLLITQYGGEVLTIDWK